MGIPQIIILVLNVLGLGISLAEHGETELKQESFFTRLFSTAIHLLLLWWGGFFD